MAHMLRRIVPAAVLAGILLKASSVAAAALAPGNAVGRGLGAASDALQAMTRSDHARKRQRDAVKLQQFLTDFTESLEGASTQAELEDVLRRAEQDGGFGKDVTWAGGADGAFTNVSHRLERQAGVDFVQIQAALRQAIAARQQLIAIAEQGDPTAQAMLAASRQMLQDITRARRLSHSVGGQAADVASREALRSEMGNMPVEYDLGRLLPELGELAALPPEARERALRHYSVMQGGYEGRVRELLDTYMRPDFDPYVFWVVWRGGPGGHDQYGQPFFTEGMGPAEYRRYMEQKRAHDPLAHSGP
jgi:hypothetical protein